MIGIGLLFCLILWNVIGGTRGVGEEVGNKDEKKDLLFGEMWRKAFEANRHNGKEAEEKEEMPKKEVKKEEQTEEEENKLWKKVKMEPIEGEEEKNGKRQQIIKKETKVGEKEWKDLVGKSEDSDQQQEEGSSDQKDPDQSADDDKKIKCESKKVQKKKPKSEERKSEIIEKFDKMRKEYKMKKDYKSEDRIKMEEKIAKELGTYRDKIFEWKREMKPSKKQIENEEEKREMIEKFVKMRKEYKIKKNYKSEDRHKIERKIAKELGTYRDKIFEWKREIKPSKKQIENEEEKRELIEKFVKMRKEYKIKNNYKSEDRHKIEQEIAKELGISRINIYKWKKELIQRKKPKTEEEKWKIIEEFGKMRNEYKMKNKYNNKNYCKIEQEIAKALDTTRKDIYKWKKEMQTKIKKKNPKKEERNWKMIKEFDKMRNEYKNQNKYNSKKHAEIEREIARELGTCRSNIYQWKKALTPLRVIYTKEQKRAIIEKFNNLCEQFSNKFNMKTSKKIEEKIAKKFYVGRISIYRWKKAMKIK